MAVWQRKKVMEKKIIETPEGRFMWKEVDENGSATGVRSEGDFATEAEAMADAGLEVAEEEEESPAPEVVDEPVSEEEVLDETEEKKTAEEESVESSEESLEETPENA
jgi:hypothetical protein